MERREVKLSGCISCQGLDWVLDARVGIQPLCIHGGCLLLFGCFFSCNTEEAGS